MSAGSGHGVSTPKSGLSSTYAPLGSTDWTNRTFNVLDYGAVGDNVTDDTEAIQAAIDAAAAAGGGRVVFPITGTPYLVAGPRVNASIENAQLTLPRVWTSSGPEPGPQLPIVLEGEVPPPAAYSVVQYKPAADQMSTLRSTLTTSGASVIGCATDLNGSPSWSNIAVTIKNLTIRVPEDPVITALDMRRVNTLEVDGLTCDAGSHFVEDYAQPPSTSYGLRMPRVDNGAWNVMRSFAAIGFYTGLELTEHANILHASIFGCYRAIHIDGSFPQAAHATRINIHHCPYGIVVATNANIRLDIEQLNIERGDNGWRVAVYDIVDTNSRWRGSVRWNVLDHVNDNDAFLASGAANVDIKQVGTATINEPASEGAAGQVLTTDGAGGRTWETAANVAANIWVESPTYAYPTRPDATLVIWRGPTDPAGIGGSGFVADVDLWEVNTMDASDVTPPSVPANLTATAAHSTEIDLEWDASTDNIAVTGYEYRIDGGSAVDAGAVLSVAVTGLTAETEYDFEVRAYDAASNYSAWSSVATETTPAASADVTPPTAGTLGVVMGSTTADLTVAGATDETALHATPYAYSQDSGSTYTAYQAGATYQYTGLTPSTEYTFRHKIRDAAGNETVGTAVTDTTDATTTILADTFTRANGAIGTAETGGAWTEDRGTWTVASSKGKSAALGTGSLAVATLDAADSDVTASVDLTWQSWGALAFRFSNMTNRWSLAINAASGLRIIKWSNSETSTTVDTYAFTPSAGTTYALKVVTSGNNIKCYLDDVLRFDVNDSFNASATRFGLNAADTTSTFDNFLVTA